MKNRFMRSMLAFGLVLFLSFTLFALAQGQRSAPAAGAAPRTATPAANAAAVDVNGKKFNPHDFSGIWIRRGGNRGFGPPNSWPPLTPAGEAVIKTRIPTPGYNRHPLVRKIDDPKDTNDPTFECNPKGFPRIVLDTAHDYNEWVTLPDRMYNLWQEARVPREIWLDGRPVPSGQQLEDRGPSWYGEPVDRLEGEA